MSTSNQSTKQTLQKLIIRQLFNNCITHAELKLRKAESTGLEHERDLSMDVLPGVDLQFDESITALAKISYGTVMDLFSRYHMN